MRQRALAAMLFAGMITSAMPEVLDAAPAGQLVTPRASPYARLFLLPGAEPVAQPDRTPRRIPRAPVSAPSQPTPKVVCGMTLIPGDPQVDPGIAMTRPQDGPRFTIRAVEPTVCR